MNLPLVSMIPQRHIGDCGVAALAMLLGVTYEDALLALGSEVPSVLRRGVWFTELQRAAARLGVTLVQKRTYDLELAEGILQIIYKPKVEHVVVLREGLFFDTDFTVWKPDEFLKAKRAKAGALLVREDE